MAHEDQPVTRYLSRPHGRVAYEVGGTGPLVVLVPGMGELRASYRFLAPVLRAHGYRVAATDLRGHGDSDVTFSAYGDAETAGDVIALIELLGAPAIVVGNSMGAAAAVLAAAMRPTMIDGLILIGPFVRDPKRGALRRLTQRIAMTPLWAGAAWRVYTPRLYAGTLPADFDAYRQLVADALRRPGYARSLSHTARASHDAAEASLAMVSVPSMVIMGDLDPDFPDPAGEATWIADRLHATVVMVPDAGHYPQSQRPELVTAAVLNFLIEDDRNA